MKVKRIPSRKQNYRKKYERLDGIFEQLRNDYWSTRDALDRANKKIELLESLCNSYGISIPEEFPF